MSFQIGIRNQHRVVGLAVALLLAASATNCGSDSTGPVDPISKIPDFIYVSNASGGAQLYTWHHGTSTLFPGSVSGDVEPQSAAGKVVFTSFRIAGSNSEIFIANNDGSNQLRLTNQAGTDHQPTLNPAGNTIIFASTRSGVSRLWTMGVDGSSQLPLSTGSDSTVPESSPKFSPGGNRLLFSSPRTGTTQIWISNADGSSPAQVTHDANGAFFGSWSPNGDFVYYVDGVDRTVIHKVEISSGDVVDYVTGGTDVGDQACTNDLCLVVTNNTSTNRDIYAYIGAGDTAPLAILNQTTASEYQPSIIR